MTPRPSRLWWLSGLAVASLTLNAQPNSATSQASTSAASAPAPTANTPRLVVTGNPNDPWSGPVNAPQLPLKLMPPILEELTGRTVLLAQGLPNPDLSIVFNSPPTRGEFLQAIETVLTMNQLALVPLGPKFLKIVPLPNARVEAPALIEESTLTLPPSGQIAAKLFTLQFLRATEFVPQIMNVLSNTSSQPVIFDKANAFLVTDSISTLQRIELIIAKTDAPTAAGTAIKFYTLTNGAKASDMVTKLRTILQPMQGQIGSATSYQPDDRTNQIILISDPRQFPLFDELIAKLDVKSDPNTRNEVIPLKHADATEVATLLNSLITGQTRAAQASGNAQNNGRPNQGNRAPNTPDAPPAPNAAPAAPAAGSMIDVGAPSNEFSSLVNLQPDVRSNAIVASGTVDDMRLIKQLIEKIDIVLPQVRIEVVIAEVTLTDQASTGISSLGLNVQNGKLVGFKASAPGIGVGGSETATGALDGYAMFNEFRDLSAIIQLSTTPRKTNNSILSVPSITVMHNKEGVVFIGETRPVISATTSNPSSASSGFSTSSSVTQQEIGTKVTVKPLIGYDGSVQLEIKQDIQDVAGEVEVDGNKQYIISKRNTESFVTAKSGEIIVLSGLQKRANSKSTSRLGPIPIIGDLFGARSRREDRTELVFFIRPKVLTNTPEDNVQAYRQIELMPNREAVMKTLTPDNVINSAPPTNSGPTINRKK
ncbi:MAG: secretin N-terminal domain-containing protein [Nibricoccus sp.]